MVALAFSGTAGCKDRDRGADAGPSVPVVRDGSSGEGDAHAAAGNASTAAAIERRAREAKKLAESFRGVEVWFVGGFMSELYDALSGQLEDEINRALDESARSLNVQLDFPGGREIDFAIGDAIADALPKIDLPIREGFFMTFYEQMRDLDGKGISYRNVSLVSPAFNTSESVVHNAAAIRALLRSADREIVLVTHSKGGLDTLHALLDAPEVWPKVRGWVAFQSPFYGSPLADSTFAPINALLLGALGGNAQSVEDLKVVTRTRYMQARKGGIRRLTRQIPVIAAYTTYESDTTVARFAKTLAIGVFSAELVTEITEIVSLNYAKTPTNLPRVLRDSAAEASELVQRRISDATAAAVGTIDVMALPNAYLRDIERAPNDGLVPKASTALPGATHRELTVGDHASPVMDVDPFQDYWSPEKRAAVTLELLGEVLNRSAGR